MMEELRPYAAGTDYDDDGFEVVALGSVEDGTRRAVMLPARAKRLHPENLELLIELQHTAARIAEDQQSAERLAEVLREGRVSWSLIGWAAGITGEGARQRWGDDED